jgi:hypothetical protein
MNAISTTPNPIERIVPATGSIRLKKINETPEILAGTASLYIIKNSILSAVGNPQKGLRDSRSACLIQ